MSDLSVTVDYARYHETCECPLVQVWVLQNQRVEGDLSDLQDSLTVEYGRHPGAAFAHKMMQSVLSVTYYLCRS